MLKNIKAVILDLDGTLVDSGFVWSKVDEEFFGKYGMEVPSDYTEKINSASFRETAEITKTLYGFSQSVEEIMEEWHEMARFEYANDVKLKEGVFDFLRLLRARNLKIGLATATSDRLFLPCLENNGVLEFFDAYAFGDEVKRSKEFPDIFLLCAKRLGVDPSDILVFDDVERAAIGAKTAGMKTCAVYDEYSSFQWQRAKAAADYAIKTFKELL